MDQLELPDLKVWLDLPDPPDLLDPADSLAQTVLTELKEVLENAVSPDLKDLKDALENVVSPELPV